MPGLIEQEIIRIPKLELYKNFLKERIAKLPSHGHLIVKSRAGNTYPVYLHRRVKYDTKDLLENRDVLVAVVDTESQPWRVMEIKKKRGDDEEG